MPASKFGGHLDHASSVDPLDREEAEYAGQQLHNAAFILLGYPMQTEQWPYWNNRSFSSLRFQKMAENFFQET